MEKYKYLIILVNYYNWQDTNECIDSLIKAKVKIGDILVIDNGSQNDSVREIHQKFPDIKLMQNQTNLGFAAANNIGIKKAIADNYEYVILLNNDTTIEQDSIGILIKTMEANSDASLGTGQIRYYNDKNKIWYAGGKLINYRGLAKHLYKDKSATKINYSKEPDYVSFISGCFLCIRVSILNLLGLLDERFFIYLEDIEYSARAVKNNLKLLYVPQSLIFHKWVGETKLSEQTLYYAVRNRNLLIDIAFGKVAKAYFLIALRLKMICWFFINRILFTTAKNGLKDYYKNYFGPIKK